MMSRSTSSSASTIATRDVDFERLDRADQLTLLTDLAHRALAAYDLEDVRLRVLAQKRNVTFEVLAHSDSADPADGSAFEPGKYVLRVCDPEGHGAAEIRSEIMWLRALRRQAGLIVPEPVAGNDGSTLRSASVDGLPARFCVLFRWIPGKMVSEVTNPATLEQVGELAARIHTYASEFAPPQGFVRPRWDCDALFGEGTIIPPGMDRNLVPRRGRQLLDEAAAVIREATAKLGEGPEVFGLIHKDLEPDNTVLHRANGNVNGEGTLCAIDFADFGWGYYLYDVAAALLPLRETAGFAANRQAFLRGYQRLRPLTAEHLDLIETFSVARSIFAARLMLTKSWVLPKIREYARTAVPRILGEIRRFMERRSNTSVTTSSEDSASSLSTTVQFLSGLRDLGIKLWTEGERLRFRAPKGALTPALRAEIKERKLEILSFLHQSYAGRQAPAPSRSSTPRSAAGSPLSFAQQRLWIIDQLVPGSVVYNIARAVRLDGEISVEILERCLNEIVRRHDALRTTFIERDGQPLQRVTPRWNLRLPLIDLSSLPEKRRSTLAQELGQADAHRPFDLSRGPLLRVSLLRLDATDHIASCIMHHIIGDGWSSGLLFRELGILYKAFSDGHPSPLPELPLQYPDFATWQRQWLQGEALEKQLSYWKAQLDGAPEVLDLPTDRPRPSRPSDRGTREPLLLPRSLVDDLQAQAQPQGATLFMILFATFNTLLYRYSAQRDIVIGFPIANRNRAEIEGLIGFFVNTLVLRTRLHGSTTFRQLLGEVRQTTLGAYAHQDLPFEKLVEELRLERNPTTGNPLFQTIFSLQNVPYPDSRISSFRMRLMAPTSKTAQFDLSCAMKELPEGVTTSWRYRQDLFDGTTIQRMARHYRNLLVEIVADPDRPLDRLPMMSRGQIHQLLEGQPAAKPESEHPSLDRLFDRQARTRPDAVALVGIDEQLSYRQLAERANRLAHHLMAQGVGPGTAVALCFDRSPNMVLAMLGVVKAGAAYVPLDPAHPQSRLAWILEDVAASVLLTEEDLLDRLPETTVETLCLDRDWPRIALSSSNSPDRQSTSQRVAYVLYTSGSTGRPKGTLISHDNVRRLFHATRPWYELESHDIFAQFHSYGFDVSVWEIWGNLLHGGRLVLVPYWVSRTPDAFLELLVSRRVTILCQTPSAFRQLIRVDHERGGATFALRAVILAGEALDFRSLRPWRQLHGTRRPRLINMYGPTETTVYATYRPLTAHDIETPGGSRIGGAVSDLQLYVLDPGLHPLPPTIGGELGIGGPGLAMGYHRRPTLTATHFTPCPFTDAIGERLYRTGDLVRRLTDGDLEFLGRIDHQIKLRGFRIELGEIEAVLEEQPSIVRAVVLVRQETREDQRLVAFWVPSEGEPSPSDLRLALRARLPDYMVPAAFVPIESLPLTPNGKIDRRALMALEPQDRTQVETVDPRNPTEELLAGIWQDVLGHDHLGVHDNFFDLGGHSLLVLQVISRVRQIVRVELTPLDLFEAPTLEALAMKVDAADRRGRDSDLPPLRRVPRQGRLPLSFAQQRLWFLDRLGAVGASYKIPCAVRIEGALDAGRLQASLNVLIQRHEILRTTFAVTNGEPQQVIAAELRLGLPVVDLTDLDDRRRPSFSSCLASQHLKHSFDLAEGPLLRALLIRERPERHLFVLVLHHIITDGWSIRILLEEMLTIYDALAADRPVTLPDLAIQYADFAIWQHRWLGAEALGSDLEYWLNQLEDLPEPLKLPADRPWSSALSRRGGKYRRLLASHAASAVQQLARRTGATLFMTVLAAFKALLYRTTGEQDLVVGSPIAGRNRYEIEGLIGFFVNTLVLRTDVSGNPTFGEVLERVRAMALDAYAHQDLPFERLVDALQPDREPSANPLFRLAIAQQDLPSGTVEMAGLTLHPLTVEGDAAKFDLTLSFQADASGLCLDFEYSRDLFDASTIRRLAGHLERLLTAAANRPRLKLTELPWLGRAEHQQILREWNDTARPESRWDSVTELIEQRSRRQPEAPAVVEGECQLSYGELLSLSNAQASILRARGVGPESIVALLMPRSLEMVVAALAILRSGAAYLPLDPTLPAERLAFCVADSGTDLVLSQGLSGEKLTIVDATIAPVNLSELRQSSPGLEPPSIEPDPDRLAYSIYTSGSSGRPKAVGLTHRGLANLIAWHRRAYALGTTDRTSHLAGLGFDAAVWEIWPALVSGATLHLAAEESRTSPSALLRWLTQDEISQAFLPTPLAEGLMQLETPEDLALRVILTGGDRLHEGSPADVPWLLVNHYGPTENSVVATAGIVAPMVAGPALPTIGRPIDNVQATILDRHLEILPIGAPGELTLAGRGLARGYLKRPSLTAQCFIPDASHGIGQRQYRTGDLVRQTPDGQLEFLGRIDYQVKIRGFRVETGEIEAVLAAHPRISESVVVSQRRHSSATDERLVAYVVAINDEAPGEAELRDFLRARLPDYMVPAFFATLDTMPLTPNGKVDRRALPRIRHQRPTDGTSGSPRDVDELQLVQIWEELLETQPIRVNESFFDLGGHSLLAVRLLARIEQAYGHEVPLGVLFEAPTIERLARRLRRWKPQSPSSLVAIQPGESPKPLFCIHPIGGNVFCYLELARHLGPELPVYGLQSRGLLDGEVPQETLEEMAAGYLAELRGVQPHGPYRLVGWSMGGSIAYEMSRQLQDFGERVELLALLDVAAPNAEARKEEHDETKELERFLSDLARLHGQRPDPTQLPQDLRSVDEGERWQIVLKAARGAGWLPPDVGADRVRRIFDVFCNNHRALDAHVPGPCAERVTFLRAEQTAARRPDLEPSWGWSDLAEAGLDLEVLPGDHYAVVRAPYVERWAECLQAALDRLASE